MQTSDFCKLIVKKSIYSEQKMLKKIHIHYVWKIFFKKIDS